MKPDPASASTRPRICVLGSINVDLVVRAPRFPAPGETILGGPFATHPGGKGANQAVAAARLGSRVAMIGAVGDDEHGRRMLDVLRSAEVDVEHVRVRPGESTGTALITVDERAENTIVVAPGANALVSAADVDAAADAVRAADLLVAQLEVPVGAIAHAADLARSAGVAVLLNAAPAGQLPDELLAGLAVLVVNRGEADALAGTVRADASDEDAVARSLLARGPTHVVVTLGDRGAAAWGPKGRLEVPAPTVRAVDTTGCGDAFVGALASAWAGGLPLSTCIEQACAAGAFAATRRGAIDSFPSADEVREALGS